MALAPMALVVPSYFIFGPRALLFGVMSPVMALFNWLSGKRQGARS